MKEEGSGNWRGKHIKRRGLMGEERTKAKADKSRKTKGSTEDPSEEGSGSKCVFIYQTEEEDFKRSMMSPPCQDSRDIS